MKKVIIWGLGKEYNEHVNLLKYYEMKKEIMVIALTDHRDFDGFSSIDGYPVVRTSEIKNIEYDYMVVMNSAHYYEIMEEAVEKGVPRNKIIPYRVLEIPMLNFDSYAKLKESRISIISNNCWGGIIYRTLGLECLSPFKNLFLEDEDYIALLKNLNFYLKENLQFSSYNVDPHSGEKYPVMRLGDVSIHCNHDANPDIALKNWNRRCKKMNMDNLLVEMYTESEEIADRFVSLDAYSNKICFVPFEPRHRDMVKLELMPGQTEFWQAVNSNAGNGNNSLTYRIIDLLNTKRSMSKRLI